MKTLFFLICFIFICNALFALGQQDNGLQSPLMSKQNRETKGESGAIGLPNEAAQDEVVITPREAFMTIGGYKEIDLLSCDPELLEFVSQCAGEKTAGLSESDGGSSAVEVIRIFRQIVRGFKYITCLRLADGRLAVFIIHKDISGEFSLLESYRDTEIFEYFGSFL